MAPSSGKPKAHCIRDFPMPLCSHQEERKGLEPRDRGRTGPTYYHSQSFTGEFCRVLSPQLWALQDENPLFPKGACSHQGTRQGTHWNAGYSYKVLSPLSTLGSLLPGTTSKRNHHLVRSNWPRTAWERRHPGTYYRQGGICEHFLVLCPHKWKPATSLAREVYV